MKDAQAIPTLHSKNIQTSSIAVTDENNKSVCVQTIHLGKDAKEAEIQEAAAAVTNGAASVILEGVDVSLLFPNGVDKDGSLTVQWDGNKDIVLQQDGSSSEGQVSLSQSHTLVELFHELFKPSNTPMQIILEPQVVVENAHSGSNSITHESGITQQESKIGSSHLKPSVQGVKKYAQMSCGVFSESKLVNQPENQNNKTDSLPSVQLIHRCFYCSFGSEVFSTVLDHVKNQHPSKPAKTKTISGRNCPYCGIRLHQTAFFQHMRQHHGDAHPFKCGYCNFMGRDLNQLKHHCSKKHRDKPFKAFRRSAAESPQASIVQNEGPKNAEDMDFSGNESTFCGVGGAVENVADYDEDVELVDSMENKLHTCPVCQKKFKTLKYLKVHMRVHSKGRYKCWYCSYLSAYCLQALLHCKKRHRHLQPRVKQHDLDPMQNKNIVNDYEMFMEQVRKKCSRQPPDPDTRKWARKYSCPHCEYTCSYGASYRRHLTTHTTKPLPFRCNYCKFEGREKYYVRRHIQRIHRGCDIVVVENKPEEPSNNALDDQGDVSSEFCGTEAKNVDKSLKTVNLNSGKNQDGSQRMEVEEARGIVDIPMELQVEGGDLMITTEDDVADGGKVLHQSIKMFENDVTTVSADNTRDEMDPSSSGPENVRVVPECLSVDVTEEKVGETSHLAVRSKSKSTKQSYSKISKKRSQKSKTPQSVCSGKQDTVILPKGGTANYIKVGVKLNVGVDPERTQEQSSTCDGLDVAKNPVGICFENLLGVSGMEKSEAFANHSSEEKSCDTLPKEGYVEVAAQGGPVNVKRNGKKKVNREKCVHKALEFVAYRDGRHTFCVCGARTVNKAFYKHIKKHNESKRFGCGYCSYRSIERAKIRVHHTFVHPGLPLNINESEEKEFDGKGLKLSACPIPWKSDNEGKFLAVSNQKKESSSGKKSSVDFQCPVCQKKISYHTYTIRRHLFSHFDYRPYKCGRCDFRGCSPGEIKQHSVYHGADLCPLVEPSGQEPPEGLEQLVTDCFKEMRAKLGKRTRNKPKANGKNLHSVGENSTKDHLVPNGYQLVTREALLWNKNLSNGICPLCSSKILPSEGKEQQGLQNDKIKMHFKDHFYKPVQHSTTEELRADECLVPENPPASLEEKDSIVLNGLMYYFLNQPTIREPNSQGAYHNDDLNSINGETGIINSPDGMPPGTIQITDSLLADLRLLLWGQVGWPKSRRAVCHTCLECNMPFRNSAALQLHAESHLKDPLAGMKDENSPFSLQNASNAPSVLQASDSEVGGYILGEDMEVSRAVVVINSETVENQETKLDDPLK